MEWVAIWLIGAALVAALAARNGRSAPLALLAALALSPLLAGLAYLIAGRSEAAERARIARDERLRDEVRAEMQAEAAVARPTPLPVAGAVSPGPRQAWRAQLGVNPRAED